MGKLKITGNSLSFAGGYIQIGTTENRWMAETKGCHVNGSNNEDALLLARRLVAAYNACEGIETESLELQVANANRLKTQNKELLEALEMAYQEIKDITESAFCSVSAEKEVMDKIRAAIAAATTSI